MSVVFRFGKYNGKTPEQIYLIDVPYLKWIITENWFSKFDDLHQNVLNVLNGGQTQEKTRLKLKHEELTRQIRQLELELSENQLEFQK